MIRACAVCELPLPEGARFCPNCGASARSVLDTDERKVVTILFTDLVDSTGLARRFDPERARDLMGRFFDVASDELSALRGRPEKFIGDAVMAVFGLPHVHEDDALRAVRAALAIQERVRRLGETFGLTAPLDVRSGIEAGEAAVGRSPTGQLMVTGAVLNAAARLQTAAAPGQILVGRTARQLTTGRVSYSRPRRVRAKGFDAPLEASAVEDLTSRSARQTIPFIGRASEQAMIGQSLGLVTTTGRPVLVTVVGEAGIGKSRLADEAAAGVGAAVLVLRGQSRAQTDTATFSPAAAIVADLASMSPGDAPETIRRRLDDLASDERTARRLGLLFGLSEQQDETSFVPEVQSGFISLVDVLTRDHPALAVFEDVHTLKAPMLDLIERLGTRGNAPRRLLVLALTRPELLQDRPTWGAAAGNSVLIRMEPLPRDDATRLARRAGGGRIGDADASRIAERTGGNPYFIIETTGMLMAQANGRNGGGKLQVPPTVQAVIAARVDALPPRLRELARRASVFSHSFELHELAVVEPDVSEDDLLQLEDAEMIVWDGQRWRLRHSTLKEVVYASLPKRERVRLHELLAQRLADAGRASMAADHFELAAFAALDLDPSDRTAANRAVDALLIAGDRARRRMESRSAIDRYQRALALADAETAWGAREARILAGLGEAHYWLAEYAPATRALERAVEIGRRSDDVFAQALALRFLGDIAINFEADVDKAEELLRRSLAAAERLGDPWAIARSLLFAGWVPWTRSRFDESEAIWRRALDVADPKDHWARVRALTALSINRSELRDADGALRLIDEARAIAESAGDRFSVATTSVQKGRVLDELGRPADALEWFDLAVATLEELGARWEQADARAARGIAKRNLGRLDEAEEDLRAAIGIAEELGDRQLPSWTWRNLARVAELRGDQAAAAELLQRSKDAELRGPR